ncbi:hypothetical protein SBV1_3260011 [Verrucomicrobia bacterium]|nr:hypothetical protein SBV1_3260011 [Verrucomicrobiota bacterium]
MRVTERRVKSSRIPSPASGSAEINVSKQRLSRFGAAMVVAKDDDPLETFSPPFASDPGEIENNIANSDDSPAASVTKKPKHDLIFKDFRLERMKVPLEHSHSPFFAIGVTKYGKFFLETSRGGKASKFMCEKVALWGRRGCGWRVAWRWSRRLVGRRPRPIHLIAA